MSNSISGTTSRSIGKSFKKKMMNKYTTANRHASMKYHNQSQEVNSRNSAKQVSAYIANKMLSTKYNDNKPHATSVSNTKDTKRMKKLVFLGENASSKKTSDKIRPQLKNTCDSVRRSQKRGTKSRYNEKSNGSKLSEGKKVLSKKKKKNNFNNTTKFSTNFMKMPCDTFAAPVAKNSKYTVSINSNRQSNMSMNISKHNRSGAKCHMLSKISTPKANAVGRRYRGFDNKSNLVSPPSSTKHSGPRGKYFNFPGTTKAKGKGMNTSEIVSAMAAGVTQSHDKNFKNMSGPIQFEKSHSGWQNNFSGLSQNSSSSKIGTKELKCNITSSSNNRKLEKSRKEKIGDVQLEDANRDMMKKISSDNKYHAILKKITQESERHNQYSNNISSKQYKSKVNEEDKDFEVVDSSGGTQDNLLDVEQPHNPNHRMYGTEKIDVSKYHNLIPSQAPIMID